MNDLSVVIRRFIRTVVLLLNSDFMAIRDLIQSFTIPLVLMIVLAVYVGFSSNIDRSDFSVAQNTTFEAIDTGTNNGFNLAAMLPYAIIGFMILGLLLSYLGVF